MARTPNAMRDHPLDEEHPPTIEHRTKPEGVDQRDDAVNQSIRDDERHQDHQRRAGLQQRDHPERQCAMPRNRNSHQ